MVEDLLFNGLEKRECTNDAQQLAGISQICVRGSRKRFSLHSSKSGCGKKRGGRMNGTKRKGEKSEKSGKKEKIIILLGYSFSPSPPLSF